jgi:ABC-type transport system involved in multi-copper enzyme maturation permease subunit
MTTSTAIEPRNEPRNKRLARSGQMPLLRVVGVELRKMFDTRAGFWLVASIAIAGALASLVTMLFAPDADLTYNTFATAVGFPMTVILPMISLLSITGEWSQRTGLTTFTLVPNRRRVMAAKTISAVVVAVASMLFALVIGALGNLVGSAIAGTQLVWDMSPAHGATIILGNLIGLLTGTMLGMLIRNSAGALVAYFGYSLVLPTLAGLLAASQRWFRDLQPWVDLNYAQSALFAGSPTGEQWANLAVTVTTWVLLPSAVGLALVMRSEVK